MNAVDIKLPTFKSPKVLNKSIIVLVQKYIKTRKRELWMNFLLDQPWLFHSNVRIWKGLHIQGLQYILTQNNSLLLKKLEHGRLPKPIGGSPDVVHLIINAPQGSEWLLKAQTRLEKKESCFEIVVKICPVLRPCDFLFPFFSFQNLKISCLEHKISFTWH